MNAFFGKIEQVAIIIKSTKYEKQNFGSSYFNNRFRFRR